MRRGIAAQPLSKETIAAIERWRITCQTGLDSGHRVCSLTEEPFAPKRLIRLQPTESGIELRLVDNDLLALRPKWAALSYRWGVPQPDKLIGDNLEAYRTSIPWTCLPKTLQDAVTTAHLLGVHYIWIDSLCIKQDDGTDLRIETGKMTKVYAHAEFTIMAKRAENADRGFLHPRNLPSGTSRLQYCAAEGLSGPVTLTFQKALEQEEETGLDTRGWVLQEHLLSRRLIIIGSWYTEWSCRAERRTHIDGWTFSPAERNDPLTYYDGEWGFSMSNSDATSAVRNSHVVDAVMFYSMNPQYHTEQGLNIEEGPLMRNWRALVKAYTRRSLTHQEDRVRAISGLAERFAPIISEGKSYTAGIWESQMPWSLLWSQRSSVLTDRPNVYQGPSWSWVSVSGPVSYPKYFGDMNPSVTNICTDQRVMLVKDEDAPFGAPKRACLQIAGPALAIRWRFDRHPNFIPEYDKCEFAWRNHHGNYVKAGIKVKHDIRQRSTNGWREVFLLALDKIGFAGIGARGIVLAPMENYVREGRLPQNSSMRMAHFEYDPADLESLSLPEVDEWSRYWFYVF